MNALIGLGLILIDLIMYVFKGFCLKWLWLWFLVPMGLPAITIPTAVGITIIVTRLTSNTPPDFEEMEQNTSEYIIKNLIIDLVTWGCALGFGFLFSMVR